MSQAEESDVRWMEEALRLATLGRYTVSPNPMVGAVVVVNGAIVGRGFHAKTGEPHAEIHAIRDAGSYAKGADLVVTLEPCCHHGRTPPCTEAIIRAGIKRVVVGATDPNPQVSGAGVAHLRAAGIDVVSGVCEAASRILNVAFEKWMKTRRPWIILKAGASLDGRIAVGDGTSQWITGPAARHHVHRLRASVDAILVGANTAVMDDPRLTVRDVSPLFEGAQQPEDPYRVIVDSQLRLPPNARCLVGKGAIVATSCEPASDRWAALESKGATLWHLPQEDGQVDLPGLMSRLGSNEAFKTTSVLVEGGGILAASLLRHDLVDELTLFMAPRLLGGDGIPMVGALGLSHPHDSLAWRFVDVAMCGTDVQLRAIRVRS